MAIPRKRAFGTPAAVRRRLRSERGQGAVEFAMVVPLLCILVLAIVDFAKAMNYWLDLNHVASEGARKAAVNTFATSGEYQTYLRDRLETGELRTGGTDSIPTGATIAICLPDGGEVGDPVTVQVSVDYHWIPFVDSAAVTIRGRATMRLEQNASYSAVGTCT